MDKDLGGSGVGVIDKAIAILDALESGPHSLAELVSATGIARPTAHRLAVALEHHRFVARDLHGRFTIGAREEELAASAGEDRLMAIANPASIERLAILAAPPYTTADQVALNTVQLEAIRSDSNFAGGWYYDAKPGFGPHKGLALARRMALLNYRSPAELNERFGRSWQSKVSPLTERGKYAVESYLDFHGNKFVRRFDANSYITLVSAMNSHDVGRGHASVEQALSKITCSTLVLGVDSDRLFPVSGQQLIADNISGPLFGGKLQLVESEFGHDGFLIEIDAVGQALGSFLS